MSPVRFNPPTEFSLAWHEVQAHKELEKKNEQRRWANEIAKQEGFNFEGRKDTFRLLDRVLELASGAHAIEHGDSYKPKDMDMYFPTAEWVKVTAHGVAKEAGITQSPKRHKTAALNPLGPQ